MRGTCDTGVKHPSVLRAVTWCPVFCAVGIGSITQELAKSLPSIQRELEVTGVQWSKVFKTSFTLLFIAYPGTRVHW